MTTYIAKISEFNGEDIETSPQEWLDQVTKAEDANGWNAARMLRTIPYFLKRTAAFKTVFLEQFTDNNTSITLRNCFYNIKQKPSESDKLIKKVCPHPPEDLNSAIHYAKRYEMAMKEANCTKLMNLAIGETSSASKTISPTNNNSNSKDINHPKDGIKTTLYHPLITSLRIAIIVESLATGKEIAESYNKTNKTGVINVTLHHNNLITNHHYHQLTIYQDCNIKPTTINLLHSQCNNSIDNPFNITKYLLKDWFNKTNLHHKTNLQQTTTESIQITNYNNKFKVTTTPDTATLEYYQSIYTHCKQRFNIPDGIEIVKKSVYQYIENRINNYFFENYNISEVRSNLYNNLVHYSQLGTEDLNSETLATYFQELNFNIIKYCEEKYSVQSKYSFDFESETETSNKGKQRLKQYSRTTPNTPTLQKTTAKHFVKLPLSITPFPILLVQPQTPSLPLSRFSRPEDFQSLRNPTQQQKPISTSANIIDYLQENESNYSESLESKETESEPEEIPENEEEMATAYIAKIPEFTGEDNDTSPQEWLDKVQKAGDANGWIAARMLKAIPYFLQETAGEWFENLEKLFENWQAFKHAFLQQFTDNNTFITFRNCFHNIKQETSESFIAGLKDKLIKKVRPHAPADLATAIRHAKSYEMAMEETNHTKLVNLAIGKTSSAAEKKIDQLTKKDTGNKIVGNYKETNKTGVINITLHYNNPITNLYHHLIIHQDHKIKTQQYQQPLPIQPYQTPPTQQYQVLARRLNNHNRINPNNQLVPRNSGQQRPSHYHTQPSYLTIPEELDFQQTAFSEGEIAAPRSNSSNHTILPAQIAQNANLSDIFPFEFEANESPFLLSNAAVNEQKAITAMYTEATVEGKPICLILDSGSAGSIITYQLMQQLKQNVDRPAQTVIVIADGMKKTPVREIDDFSFSINGITISVKSEMIETQELKILYQGQYTIVPATCGTFNKRSEKAPVFEFEEEKEMPLTETYMALGSTSNWAEETEQEIFEESRG
ncbi:hypothetical protein G9A89_012173 [Geosiphon pyriformis]|nr:hypothetical protein G9A89_012173 [Geosiphon pyriformis]